MHQVHEEVFEREGVEQIPKPLTTGPAGRCAATNYPKSRMTVHYPRESTRHIGQNGHQES
jgi:hypothetical protein